MRKLLDKNGLAYFWSKLKTKFIFTPDTPVVNGYLKLTESGVEWSLITGVFKFKGIVNSVTDLPSTNNEVGDVYLVSDENTEYVWVNPGSGLASYWECLGPSIIAYTASNGIEIDGTVIKAKNDNSTIKVNDDGLLYVDGKLDTLTEGKLIDITNNVISADVPTVKHELIYSDDNSSLTTHQLMFTGGLVVDTAEDLELCEEEADISMSSVLSTWTAYGSNSDDKNQWGYCDSTGSESTQTVTKVGGGTQSVPVFKYNGKPLGYIFNTKNTSSNTGYYSPNTYSEYNSIITCGVIPSLQVGNQQDYMGIIAALTLDGENGASGYNYGISIHVENESSTVYGRPNNAGGGDPTTILVIAWKLADLNSNTATNINILTAPQGLTVIPYDSSLNNASGTTSITTSCILTRTLRKGNIITFFASNPYKVCTDSLTSYNDDYNFRSGIHLDRPITINLDTYTVTYVKADGTMGINDFSSTGVDSNTTVREIFDKLKGLAHRGFEAESNPGTFFRNVTADELILDVTPGENKVYKYNGNQWVAQNTTPQLLFQNGSRIAWNRITDKLFYNDGASIYRISPSQFLSLTGGTLGGQVFYNESGSSTTAITKSKKYNWLEISTDTSLSISLPTVLEGKCEVIYAIKNTGQATVVLTLPTGSGIHNMYGEATMSIPAGKIAEVCVTFWSVSDISFNGGIEL